MLDKDVMQHVIKEMITEISVSDWYDLCLVYYHMYMCVCGMCVYVKCQDFVFYVLMIYTTPHIAKKLKKVSERTGYILGTLSADDQIQSISHNYTTRAIIWFPRMLPDTEVE